MLPNVISFYNYDDCDNNSQSQQAYEKIILLYVRIVRAAIYIKKTHITDSH